jgi:tetratricopeptide (TPR) repeat protein
MLGDHALALDTARRALELGTELADFRIQVDARHFLGTVAHSLGDHARSCELLSANVAALSGAWLEGRFGAFYAVGARTWLVYGMAPRGQLDAADALAQEGLRIAEAAGYPGDIVSATWSLGYARLQRGDLAAAVAWLERAEKIANDAGVTVWQGPVLGALGYARVLQGDVEGGVRLLETVTAPDAIENQIGLCEWQAYMGEAYLLAHRLEEAEEVAQRALAQSRRWGERPAQAQALRVQAEIATKRGLVDNRAGQLFDEALALADQLGMHTLAAHCHAGLARLYHRAGASAEAQEHFTKATAIYRDRSMSHWLNKAQRELAASEFSAK